jgi:hypothetical protein
MASHQDHGVVGGSEIEKHERRVTQVFGYLGEGMIYQARVSVSSHSSLNAKASIHTMMKVRGTPLHVLVESLQVTPGQRGLELGKIGKLFESAVPQRREQVGCQQWQGEEDKIRHDSE